MERDLGSSGSRLSSTGSGSHELPFNFVKQTCVVLRIDFNKTLIAVRLCPPIITNFVAMGRFINFNLKSALVIKSTYKVATREIQKNAVDSVELNGVVMEITPLYSREQIGIVRPAKFINKVCTTWKMIRLSSFFSQRIWCSVKGTEKIVNSRPLTHFRLTNDVVLIVNSEFSSRTVLLK